MDSVPIVQIDCNVLYMSNILRENSLHIEDLIWPNLNRIVSFVVDCDGQHCISPYFVYSAKPAEKQISCGHVMADHYPVDY